MTLATGSESDREVLPPSINIAMEEDSGVMGLSHMPGLRPSADTGMHTQP